MSSKSQSIYEQLLRILGNAESSLSKAEYGLLIEALKLHVDDLDAEIKERWDDE